MFNVILKSFGLFTTFRFSTTWYLENGCFWHEVDQNLDIGVYLTRVQGQSHLIWFISIFPISNNLASQTQLVVEHKTELLGWGGGWGGGGKC